MENHEKAKLDWMKDHDYSVNRLARSLISYLSNFVQNRNDLLQINVDAFMDMWEENCGFDGDIWPCQREWKDQEAYLAKTQITEANGETLISHAKATPQEALARSLAKYGKPDIVFMIIEADKDEDELYEALKNIIYPLPDASEDGFTEYETADKYLSGTTKELYDKLKDAINAAEFSDAYDCNVIALQKKLCRMSFAADMTSRRSILAKGGWFDRYDIPHFSKKMFDSLQYTSDSVTCPGKRTIMIPTEKGPGLYIEGVNFIIES